MKAYFIMESWNELGRYSERLEKRLRNRIQ